MSQAPSLYQRLENFVSDSTNNPNITVPQIATGLDSEFVAVQLSLNDTINRLAEIQRDDGALRDFVVSTSALSQDVLALLALKGAVLKGAWGTGTDYAQGDVVTSNGGTYFCSISHTSGTFSVDQSAGKWLTLEAPYNNSVTVQRYTSNGVQTAYSLGTSGIINVTNVFISGVYQNKDTYTINGNTLTFSEAPPSGSVIEIIIGSIEPVTAVVPDFSISTAKLADSAVTTIKLADSNVTTAKIADSNVTTAKIADASVTTAKIANLSVSTAKISDSAVTNVKIAESAVTNSKIAFGAVEGFQLAPGAVIANIGYTPVSTTDARLSDTRTPTDNTVSTAKIVNGAVTDAKLATTLDLSTKTLTLPNNCVGRNQITDLEVQTADIANGAITSDKLASAVQSIVPKAFGQVSSVGALVNSTNIASVSLAATGIFTITLNAGILTAGSCVQVTIGPSATVGAMARIGSITPASNQIVINTSTTGTAAAHPFHILVI